MTESQKMPMLKAMVLCKCPICTEGDMFKTPATNLKHFNELKTSCDVCGFMFMPEPGFYQISLFFTYAVGVAIFIVFWVATYWLLNDPPLWVYYWSISIPAVVTAPWNLRYSKVFMLYLFGGVWDRGN
ncbi:MAG TPA: DUF983 domain-containing protein [Lunatimonas sp.]|nr:DUF983 domain-containing protein [Lunatimonas sp.]